MARQREALLVAATVALVLLVHVQLVVEPSELVQGDDSHEVKVQGSSGGFTISGLLHTAGKVRQELAEEGEFSEAR
eukprot:CAMPEP_0173430948 /NCGR_PEP_ID=MMETSP1357-20121228/9229_1 /TAXON_ID=77926 /ORGANISM="Hemiselmis rufescens, Strain PCC563" /LENGTH=75 /DNA_ID=CAMNT_0014395363 /DNA_START=31 /DNA_END=254 /DNA_ORIENTATION=-